MIDDCSIYVIFWPMDFWNIEKFLHLSVSLLSTSYSGFAFFFFVPRDHVTDHTTQLALPQACCILALLSIFLYIWFLLLGLPFTFCWPGKYVLVFCVLVWASVVGKPTTSSSMPLLCVPTAGTHFTQITTHICFLVCLYYWTESPPTHGYSKQLWSSAWNLVCFQRIHSFKRWMNEQNLLDFTSIWHLNKHVCMSMYKGTCVKRGPWKSGMDGRVLFFFFTWLCVYMRVKKLVRRHQLICKFVTIVGTEARNIC